jgi:tape measure domain-containing protein
MQALGFRAKEVIPILKDAGNALAASGSISGERLDRVVKALSDVRAKGKLESQEIRQFAENGIPAWEILERQFGKSRAELVKMVEAGQVSSEIFLQAFHKFSETRFGDLMERQSRTFSGAMSNIKDILLQTSATSFKPLFDQIDRISVRFADELQGANGIASIVDKSKDALADLGGSIAGFLISGLATKLREGVKDTLGKVFHPSQWLDINFGGLVGLSSPKALAQRIWGVASAIGEGISPSATHDEVNTQPFLEAQQARLKRMQEASDAARQDSEEFTKKQTKLMTQELTGATLQLRYYGQNTHVAATEQKLLAAGITDLNSGLAAQILQAAQAADALDKYQREQARALQQGFDKIEETYRRQQQANEALASIQRGAIDQTLELTADVRTGLSEVEKFDFSLARMAAQAGMSLDEFNSFFGEMIKAARSNLKDLDDAKLDNLIKRELTGLEDKIYEVNNATKDGLNAFQQYELWLIKSGGAARFTKEQLQQLRQAFEDLEKANREAKKRQDADSANDTVSEMGRDVVKRVRELRAEFYQLELTPVDKFLDQLEEIKQFQMKPGALDDFSKFLNDMKGFDEQAVAKKFAEFLPREVGDRAGEIAATVARAIATLRGSVTDLEKYVNDPVTRAERSLQKQLEESQHAIAVSAGTASLRYQLAWQDAINEVALASDGATLSMIRNQVRLADATVYHADQANAKVLDYLASQRSVTEVIADAKIGVISSTFDLIDRGLDRATAKLGVMGSVLKDLISGFIRLALNRAFQSMMFGGGGGGAQAGGRGFSLAPLLGGLFGGGGSSGGYLTGGFAGGASPAAALLNGLGGGGGGGITAPQALTGGALSTLSPDLRRQLSLMALDLPEGAGAGGGGLLSQVGGAAGAMAPLLGLTLGASLGGSSGLGKILGGAGGLLGGLVASGLVTGGGLSLLGGTAGSLAGFLGLGGGLLGAATLGIGAAVAITAAILLGRNAQRRKDETARNSISNDTGTAIWNLIDRARFGQITRSQAESEWRQIDANYHQQIAKLKDGKTRRNAELQWTNDFAPLKKILDSALASSEKREAFKSDFVPTFATGGGAWTGGSGTGGAGAFSWMTPFSGRVPGTYDRRDDRLIRVSGDEVVLRPDDWMPIQDYLSARRVKGFADGGSLSPLSLGSASTASGPIQITLRVELGRQDRSRIVLETIGGAEGGNLVAGILADHIGREGMDGLLGDITFELRKRGLV